MHDQTSLGHGGDTEANRYAVRGLAGSVTVLEGRMGAMEQLESRLIRIEDALANGK